MGGETGGLRSFRSVHLQLKYVLEAFALMYLAIANVLISTFVDVNLSAMSGMYVKINGHRGNHSELHT